MQVSTELDTPTAFASAFRGPAYRANEFSFDQRPECFGIMIAGATGFFSTVDRFASALPFAAEWAWRLRRFVAAVEPDAYLFRVDWSGREAIKVTLYCRFQNEPSDNEFFGATGQLHPTRWTGPSPERVGATLGVRGPRGIGFEVGREGIPGMSVYFRVPVAVRSLPPEATRQLVAAVGLPDQLVDQIEADIRPLYASASVGVIGVDNGQEGACGALKFNPPNVSLEIAMGFLEAKRSDPRRVAEIISIAQSLRARWVSYLGVRYGSAGFDGWRVYLSVAPQRIPPVLLPSWMIEPEAIPTLMLPHY